MLDAIGVRSDMPSLVVDFVKEKEEGYKRITIDEIIERDRIYVCVNDAA
jgi:hypothetical protein